ncbi:hypothetical protein [Pseudomonas phage 98PfluR60PP]|uniref:ATPase n=1 Tax=Pseudomonas phage 98PfluR60PP TaxID=2163965 RepID=A0A2S1PFU6_9CAUD|nr:ATPase [Pseudomonas phage 98PfluR60PP]AWH15442.1 hypothetical protein [Pseudomonas phage 98PfluR60PP]
MFKKEFHVTLSQAAQLVKESFQAGVVPMLRGSPGIGKSAIIHWVSKEMNLLVIDARFAGYDPTDVNGFPGLVIEEGIAKYYPLETFPLEGQELPINPLTGERYAGWVLFMDEFNSAPRAVQAASYKLVLDRMVGQRKLHPAVHMCAAGNLDSDQAITEEMSTAMVSRICNLQVKEDLKSWMTWAESANINTLVTSYLQWRKDKFYTFNPETPDRPFAAPRTWEFTHNYLGVWADNNVKIADRLPILAGLLDEAVALDFKAFAMIRDGLPRKEDILANPASALMPSDLGPLYALTGALADWANEDNLQQIIDYTSRMNPPDFQVATLRSINARNPQFSSHPVLTKWMTDNMSKFLG